MGPDDQKIIIILITESNPYLYPRHHCPNLESALVDGVRMHLVKDRGVIVEAHMLGTTEAWLVTEEQLQQALAMAHEYEAAAMVKASMKGEN